MPIDVESLMAPISADSPCGVDLGQEADFFEFETFFKGEEERQMGSEIIPATEPDWAEVVTRAKSLLAKGRHLDVQLKLTVGLMRRHGGEGLHKGLELISETLRMYWGTVYPQPDEDGDAMERVNIVAQMSGPLSTMGDAVRFRRRLRDVAILRSKAMGEVTLHDALTAEQGSGEAVEDLKKQINAVVQSAEVTDLAASVELFVDCARLVREIDDTIQERVGAADSANLEDLHKDFKEINRVLAGWQAERGVGEGDAEPDDAGGEAEGDGGSVAPAARGGPPGAVSSAADAAAAIKRVRDFYEKTEPSSPVPMVLEVAQCLIGRTFKEIAGALPPERIETMNRILEAASGGNEA